MNTLDPRLKNLMAAAQSAEQAAESAETLHCPEGLARRVAANAPASGAAALSLLDFMVQRAAAVSAVIGGASLTAQYISFGAPLGSIGHAITRAAGLFRDFLP